MISYFAAVGIITMLVVPFIVELCKLKLWYFATVYILFLGLLYTGPWLNKVTNGIYARTTVSGYTETDTTDR